ncbi:MAG: hypothetical protein HQL01_08730 [Nitrospirae bacterium]|nr:hypothetical protein [Nitrospirota bacterium]
MNISGLTQEIKERLTMIKFGLPAVAAAVLLLTLAIFTARLYAVNGALNKIEARYAEFDTLTAQYEGIMEGRQGSKEKLTARAINTAETIDEILTSMSLKARLSAVKSAGQRAVMEYTEETVEIKLRDLTANELINILYVIEHGGHPLSIKTFKLKKAFEDPDKLELTASISMITAQGGEMEQKKQLNPGK